MTISSQVIWEEKRGLQGRVLRWEGALVLLIVIALHGGLVAWTYRPHSETAPFIPPQPLVGVFVMPTPAPKPAIAASAPPPRPKIEKKKDTAQPPKLETKPNSVATPKPATPAVATTKAAQHLENISEIITPTPTTAGIQESATEPAPAVSLQTVENTVPEIIPPKVDAEHANNPAPRYPPLSRRLGEEGEVQLLVHILEDGSVGEIKLKVSSGYARLDTAAREAISRWRYVPARQGGEPISYWYVQPVAFSLKNR